MYIMYTTFMQHTINVNSTFARQNFFQILEQAAYDGKTFIIEKKNLSAKIVLAKLIEKKKKSPKVNIMKLAGSLSSAVPYQKNEVALARELYARNQAKKY